MRVACPSCKTVYNVDDAKIPASGANLKCAKCKASFPVKKSAVPLPGGPETVPLPGGPETVPLPGGAPGADAVPLPGGPETVPLPGAGFAPPSPEPGGSLGFGDADFGAPPPAPAPGGPLGFGDVDFAAPPPAAGAGSGMDFGGVDFGAPPPAPPPPAADGSGLDFGGVDFGAPPPAPPQSGPGIDFGAPPAPAGSGLDFGGIDFGAPPAPPPPAGSGMDFGGVDFGAPPPPPASGAPGSEVDFLSFDAPAAPPAGPPPSADSFEFDPSAPARDEFEADLSAPMPGASAPAAAPGADNDLELLDFIDEAGASAGPAAAGRRPRRGSERYQIRRKSGKVFGPFDQAAVVKMLGEGQLLGNEDVTTDGENWLPIGSVPAFAEAIQKLMESPGGLPGLAAGGMAEVPAESSEEALERIKALYGDRMAAIAIVDTQAASRKFRRKLPFIIGGALLLAFIGTGVYLGFTPYGFFGMRRLFPKTLTPGTAAYAKFQEASKALGEDTFEGYKRALSDAESLLAENDAVIESRALFAQAVFYLKRRYFAADDKLPKAKLYLDELVLAAKDKPEVIKARAGYHLLKGEESQIRAQLESAASRKDDPEFLFLLAESYYRERNVKPAAEALNKVLANDDKSAKALHGLGLLKTFEKPADYDAALDYFQRALDANPRHLSSAVEIAAILVQKLAQPDKASSHLQRTLTEEAKKLLSPSDLARAHYLMGMVHAARHEAEPAQKEFEAALRVYPDSAPAKAAYGRYLLKRREYDKSLELFDAAFATDDSEIDYLDGLVRAMVGASKLHTAAKTLADASGKHPGSPRIAFLQGRVADEIDKGEEAERNYKRAISGDASYWEPLYYLGRFHLKRKRLDEAKAAFSDALQKAPGRPEPHVGMGNYLMATGTIDEAKREFLAALEIDREYAPAHFGLAEVLFAESAFDDAKKEYETVLELDPTLAGAYTRYATLLWRLGDREGAASMFEKAKSADPKDLEAIWQLGAVYFELERYNDAVKNIEAALTIDPAHADSYFYKARVHYVRHENTQGIEAMKAALERASMRPHYYYWMGNILYQAQRFAEAFENWQQAIKLDANYADALEAVAKGHQEQMNHPEAITFFEKTLQVDGERKRLIFNIAESYFAMNQFDKAIAKYQEALKADPTLVGAYFKIGRCYNEKGRLNDAVVWYQRAVKNDPDAKEVWRFLGYAYKERGKNADATTAFEKYVELNPDAGDVPDILNEIYDLKNEK
ncbi:MAG: tetratricopeptide repeat protein [Myxococcales bacterium]|jgi:predicted Zn finger-like uncharacterized protein